SDVQRAAAIAPRRRDRLAGVEPDPDPEWKCRLTLGPLARATLQLHGSANRRARGSEDAQGLVAAEFNDLAALGPYRLAGDRGEPARKRRGCLVAALVAVARVPAQIGDQESADARRFAVGAVGPLLVPHSSEVYDARSDLDSASDRGAV